MPKLITSNVRLRAMLRKALKAATPSLREVAHAAGLTYHAIRLYQAGQRTPALDVVRRLAKALRGQSRELAKLADELEQAARNPSQTARRKP